MPPTLPGLLAAALVLTLLATLYPALRAAHIVAGGGAAL